MRGRRPQPNQVDIEFLPKGLHDIGQAGMSARLSEVLAAVDETKYEAVLLGYGLCSNGLVGLTARSIPLVVPRAHDCITLFLGEQGAIPRLLPRASRRLLQDQRLDRTRRRALNSPSRIRSHHSRA